MKQRLVQCFRIVAWALCLALGASFSHADEEAEPVPGEGVPLARNLQLDSQLARNKKGVVLVLFSSEHCGYCERVLNEFLIPMSRNPDYQQKLVMRRVDSTGYTTMLDFDGNTADHRKFSSKQGVRMVPMVMLFDTEGRRLTKPLVGLTTVDYYGFYLDQAIDSAINQVVGKIQGK